MTEPVRHAHREGWLLVVTFLAAPLSWTLHLLLSYLAISFGCASGWNGTRIVLIALTLVLAGASLFSAYGVYRDGRDRFACWNGLRKVKINRRSPHFCSGLA